MALGRDVYKATEQEVRDSGLPYVLMRDSWYLENHTAQLPAYLAHGVAGAAGEGPVSAATRADYAGAGAEVLTTDGHTGRAYELRGEAFTLTELAAEVARQTGRDVRYTDLPVDRYTGLLVAAGLPEPYTAALADADRGLARGALFVPVDDLEKLIGRRPTSLADAVRAAL